ncbi:MAG: 4-amino-4-deoxy-L-arabinose transferase, partial [Kovacikia sp.]
LGPCLNFLLFSVLLVSPFNWFGFFRSLKRPVHSIPGRSTYFSVAFWVFILSTVTLTIISLRSAALYYWNITAYLLLFPLIPGIFLQAGERRQGGEGRGEAEELAQIPNFPAPNSEFRIPTSRFLPTSRFWSGQFYGLLFATLLVVHYSVLPISALFSKEEDPDSRMLFGWDQVAAVVKTEMAELAQFPLVSPSPNPFLVTTDYRSAAALAFQLKDPAVMAISDRVDQFDFWYTSDSPFKGRNAVILSDDWHPVQPELLAQFEQTSMPITVSVTRFGIWIKNYYVLKGFRFKGGRVSEAIVAPRTG